MAARDPSRTAVRLPARPYLLLVLSLCVFAAGAALLLRDPIPNERDELEIRPLSLEGQAAASHQRGSDRERAQVALPHASARGAPEASFAGAASTSEAPKAAPGLTGELVDAEGLGREGIPLFLIGPHRASARTDSDARGSFRFAGVEGGRHRLRVGSRDSPWIPETEVDLGEELQDLGAIVLPPLASLEILVVDESGAPLPEARVFVPGSYELETDAHGRCFVPSLPVGMHRFFASIPAIGRGNTVLELEAGEAASTRIVLRKRAGP